MAIWTCDMCGESFKRETSKKEKARFCSVTCYRAWQKNNPNRGVFQPKQEPWNKGMKGIHLSPKSEFVKGRRSNRTLPVGSVTIRTNNRDASKQRAYVKIAEPNIWKLRALVVWETANGQVPKGMVLHHVDKNPLNDTIDNLVILTRAEHIRVHRQDLLNAKK